MCVICRFSGLGELCYNEGCAVRLPYLYGVLLSLSTRPYVQYMRSDVSFQVYLYFHLVAFTLEGTSLARPLAAGYICMQPSVTVREA